MNHITPSSDWNKIPFPSAGNALGNTENPVTANLDIALKALEAGNRDDATFHFTMAIVCARNSIAGKADNEAQIAALEPRFKLAGITPDL